MKSTFHPPAWLRPESPAPTFIFLGALIVLVLFLLWDSNHGDYRETSSNPTAQPFQLSKKNQFFDPLGEKKLTAADQSREPAELKLIHEIRTRILGDQRLSRKARGTVVVTNEEAVTLRGTAVSNAEKQAVGNHAQILTHKRVNNELQIQ
jgi:hypothetical protein